MALFPSSGHSKSSISCPFSMMYHGQPVEARADKRMITDLLAPIFSE
jgi:hypothetical protein